jgi:DNA-binding LacI/PurR family transcriptional regulator
VALTTVRLDLDRLGASAVQWVTTRLQNAPAEQLPEPSLIIRPDLVIRRSTAAPRRPLSGRPHVQNSPEVDGENSLDL